MMFTDCQMWNSNGGSPINQVWKEYLKIAPNAKLYLFDLLGYGNTPINVVENRSVYLIAGWSDKVFDVLSAIDMGESALDLIHKIEI